MARTGILKLACMVVVLALVAAPFAEAAIPCATVVQRLSPCIDYLRKGGAVPVGCCNGVRGLNNGARTTADRRALCQCVKSSAVNVRGLKPFLVATLPAKCGVKISYKISPSTDCSKVQ